MIVLTNVTIFVKCSFDVFCLNKSFLGFFTRKSNFLGRLESLFLCLSLTHYQILRLESPDDGSLNDLVDVIG
jgi:hypothetical protein